MRETIVRNHKIKFESNLTQRETRKTCKWTKIGTKKQIIVFRLIKQIQAWSWASTRWRKVQRLWDLKLRCRTHWKGQSC